MQMPEKRTPFWLRIAPSFVSKRLDGRVAIQAILHNTGWLAADRILRLVVGLVVGAWVVRYLGPDLYGELSFVIAVSTFFQVVSMLGLDGVAIRDIARDRDASPAILGTVFRLRFASGFLCWLLAIALMAVFRSGDRQTLLLTAIVCGSFVFQAGETIDIWFQSQTNSKMTVLAKGISYLLSNLTKVGLILYHAPLAYFAAAMLVESALTACALLYSYRKYPAPFFWKYDRQWALKLLKESWPYLLANFAVMVYMRVDQIMLREMLGVRELSIFSAAMPISTMWYFLPVMLSQSVGPSIAKKKQVDQVGYASAINSLYTIMWWVMLPLCVIVAIVSVPLVQFLFGPSFSKSASVLAIHVFSCVPVALGSVQDLWNLNEKKNSLSLKKALAGVMTNILLNLFLIPRYGATGAAMATVASQSVYGIFSNFFLDRTALRAQLLSVFGVRDILKQ
jgi:PST family polysaccharide transporter